ncbi:MAG TPA: hypothetical protein VHU79_03300 [Sphingomicrobium sp.]|jgi:hypothetical protein|nr:hypothetical protein [Sphingomicrobium sp.]
MKAAPTRVNPLAGPQRARHVAHMTGKDKDRDERLAAALRENLKRRKAQLRKIGTGEKKDENEG